MRTSILPFIQRVTIAAVFAAATGRVRPRRHERPDAGGYTASDATRYASLVDISGTGGGASVLAGIDDGVAPLTLPFTFQFYGRPYTTVCASANGAL